MRGRGITCDLPKSLRWHPHCFHKPTNDYRGAIVAQVGTRGAIHRTFLGSDGARLRERAKLMLGPCQGAAVHLAEGGGPLVICEGIETGLSLASGLLDGSPRVWAALSASGLKAINLPAVPGELIVAPDNDANQTGQKAATALANRATTLGWNVSLLMPETVGTDWNDVLVGRAAA